MILLKHFVQNDLNVFAHSLSIRTSSRPLLRLSIPRNIYLNSRMASKLPRNALFGALVNHDNQKIAISHPASHQKHSYGELVRDVAFGRDWLDEKTEHMRTKSKCIAFLVDNGYEYVVALLSIIASGAVAVPLAPSFPISELKYVVDHCEAKILFASGTNWDKAQELVRSNESEELSSFKVEDLYVKEQKESQVHLENAHTHGGMMLYTSGTTNKPKGVLLQVDALIAQAQSLIEAWRYSTHDLVLNVLPLHHIHGTVNALLTPLLAGSTVEFLYPFNAEAVWNRLAAPFLSERETMSTSKVTFFTAVPTIYSRLIQNLSKVSEEIQTAAKIAISPENLRLNISGSAALPVPIKSAWSEISNGNSLLERYGMTEVGMALSCGLNFQDRVDGSVGWPLPKVNVRLVDTETNMVIPLGDEIDSEGKPRHGEIHLQGPTVFSMYWHNPDATAKDFVNVENEHQIGGSKWFKTGDIAIRRMVEGTGASREAWAKGPMYFIQGRQSADIIKTGGEKVSALEVERVMLSLPEVDECAVLGLSSESWGQKVAAIVVLSDKEEESRDIRKGKIWGPMDMRRALRERLAAYKIPQEMKILDAIPKNAMGKVNKRKLAKDIFGE